MNVWKRAGKRLYGIIRSPVCKLFLMLCLVITMAIGTTGYVFATSSGGGSGSSESEKFALSNIAMWVAQGFSEDAAITSGNPTVSTSMLSANTVPGTAASLMGYTEQGFFGETFTIASRSINYDSYRNLKTDEGGANSDIYYYCLYGYLLSDLGLDSTATASTSMASMAMGVSTYCFYLLAMSISVGFGMVADLLKTFNPFDLFARAVNVTGLLNLPSYVASNTVLANNQFALTIENWYSALYNLSYYVAIPLFLVGIAVSFFLLRNAQAAKSKLKKFVIRLMFLVVGIPILGGLYTGVVHSLGNMNGIGTSAINRVICSTFVDFESWASQSRLAVPANADLSITSNGQPTSHARLNVRNTAFEINKALYGDDFGINGEYSPYDYTGVVADAMAESWNDLYTSNTSTDASSSGISSFEGVSSLLLRYMMGQKYEAAAFAEDVKSKLDIANEGVYQMFDEMQTPQLVIDKGSSPYDSDIFNGASIYGNGSLNIDSNNNYYTESRAVGTTNSISMGVKNLFGLSSLGMYNYLSTDFGESTAVVYSAGSASGFVRQSHKSVSIVGSGLYTFLYWLDCCTLLAVFGIIGWVYIFSMIFGMFSRTIKMITTIPFALLGVMSSIAKVILYTVMMIFNIIGTLFMYSVIVEIAMNLSSIVMNPLIIAFSQESIIGNSLDNLSIIILIVEIVVYIVFIVQALRLRKSFIRTIDEMANSIISKFLETSPADLSQNRQPGVLSRAAGAVGQGAGMALGAKMINGGHTKNVQAASPESTQSSNGSGASGGGNNGDDGGGGGSPNPETEVTGSDRKAMPDNSSGSSSGSSSGTAFPKGLPDMSEAQMAQEGKEILNSGENFKQVQPDKTPAPAPDQHASSGSSGKSGKLSSSGGSSSKKSSGQNGSSSGSRSSGNTRNVRTDTSSSVRGGSNGSTVTNVSQNSTNVANDNSKMSQGGDRVHNVQTSTSGSRQSVNSGKSGSGTGSTGSQQKSQKSGSRSSGSEQKRTVRTAGDNPAAKRTASVKSDSDGTRRKPKKNLKKD